jgi:hypothetical protein
MTGRKWMMESTKSDVAMLVYISWWTKLIISDHDASNCLVPFDDWSAQYSTLLIIVYHDYRLRSW